jgi:hypothetical protein
MERPMKKSVFLHAPTVEAIKKRSVEGEENFSGTLNAFTDRYLAMIRASLKAVDLTTSEWTALFSIYAGTMTQQDAEGVAKMLLAEVLDSEQYETGECPHLPEKIQGMNFCERMAVVDMIDRFWSRDWDSFENYDEVIAHLKAGA